MKNCFHLWCAKICILVDFIRQKKRIISKQTSQYRRWNSVAVWNADSSISAWTWAGIGYGPIREICWWLYCIKKPLMIFSWMPSMLSNCIPFSSKRNGSFLQKTSQFILSSALCGSLHCPCFLTSLFFCTGGVRKFGRNNPSLSQIRVARNISVKDVISVLEREPQMLKSALIYRLYDKIRTDTATE